ncbi:hypothetical protein GCM10010412_050640 [Nonomuraea recticatena]|uniref:Uncharacterized protein n=1 Tax=Nonomuraea recticatena TaxID=46178 RepID=A0ABN3S932_9ACTN
MRFVSGGLEGEVVRVAYNPEERVDVITCFFLASRCTAALAAHGHGVGAGLGSVRGRGAPGSRRGHAVRGLE